MKKYSYIFSLEITHEIDISIMKNVNPSSCLQWNQLWNQLLCRLFTQNRTSAEELEPHHEEENLLPYDIIVDILTRLPAKVLLHCGQVCTPLRPFITTPSFVDLHLHRATPIIVFQNYYHCQIYSRPPEKTTYKVDINFTSEKNMGTVLSKRVNIDLRFATPWGHCMSFLYGSQNGFLLFKNTLCHNVLFIWNPITQEKLTLDTRSHSHAPCAFYFHPRSREHRVLVRSREELEVFEYIVVSLETKLSRVITCRSSYPPLLNKNPIILNGALHWPVDTVRGVRHRCSNSILAFSMDREDFWTISHPGYQCGGKRVTHSYIQIIDMEGKLCYCDYQSPCTEISLWILEDYDNQVWVKKHLVNTDPMKNSLTDSYSARQLDDANVEVVHMYGDELLINLFRRNLFLYNLQLGTFRRVGVGWEMSISSLIRPVVHINSLVSMKKTDGRHA